MTCNLASPRARWRKTNPMAAHDRLPPDLRAWAAGAALPWSTTSLLRIWQRALRDTGCPKQAIARLTQAEAKTLLRDAAVVWGPAYPADDLTGPHL
ncbi:DUF6525 family protein [Rhodobacter sp. SY28-1]|uniref:DUF6525 family protein n=1 Tax=Rhodobacter sp. SY28-1 TaxID=2562317 RepID=UPI0010C00D97|nr:DUF6525 family protein [Rhodobacter sp. SY28-1]